MPPVKRLLMQPTLRSFSNQIKPQTNNYAGMLLMGGAMGGMAYLTYTSMQMRQN